MSENKKTVFNNKSIKGFLVFFIIILLIAVLLFNFENIRNCIYGNPNDFLEDYTNGRQIVYIDGVPYAYKSGIETELFIGIDKDGKIDTKENNTSQSDFLLLCVIDNTQQTYTMLHINRDTMTWFDILGINNDPVHKERAQIALAHATGDGMAKSCKNTVSAVSELLYGVKIEHYCCFTMSAIPVVNDYLGGVTVTVEDDLTPVDKNLYVGATVKLNGKQAEKFIRSRTGLSDSTNLNRMNRQKNYMNSMMDLVKIQSANGNFVTDLYSKVDQYTLIDCTVNVASEIFQSIIDYEFKGIISPKGESVVGSQYVEHYVDEASLKELVKSLFLEEVAV